MANGQDRLLEFSKISKPQEQDSLDRMGDFLQRTAPIQEEEPDQRQDKVRDFLRETEPGQQFQPDLETAEPSTLETQQPPLLPLEDQEQEPEELSELERIAFDITRFTAAGGGKGQMPLSRSFDVYNSLQQGLGDFIGNIPIFASGVFRALSFAKQQAEWRGDEIAPISETMAFRVGKGIKDNVEEIFPNNPEFQQEFVSQMGRAAGTLAGQAGLTALTGGGALLLVGLMTASFSGAEYEQALEATGDEDKAFQTLLLNIPVNSIAAIPVFTALRKMDKLTGGGLKKVIKGSTIVGLQEAITEVGQTYGQNIVADAMYDAGRDWSAGAVEGGAMGFLLGAGLGAFGLSMRQRSFDPDASIHERTEASNTARWIDDALESMPAESRSPINRNTVEIIDNLVEGGTLEFNTESTSTVMRNEDGSFVIEHLDQEGNVLSREPMPDFENARSTFVERVKGAEHLETEHSIEFVMRPRTLGNDLKKAQFALRSGSVGGYNLKTGDPVPSTMSLLPEAINTKSKFGKLFEKVFVDLGRFPDPMRKVIRRGEAVGRKFQQDITNISRDMKTALKEEYGVGKFRNPFASDKIPGDTIKAMNNFMDTGESLDSVPQRLREPLRDMRLHIDRLEATGLELGLFEGGVKASIEKGKGPYVYRTYKKHQYPKKWADMVPQDVRNRAKNWLDNQYKQQGMKKNDAELEELVRKLLLVDDSPIAILGSDTQLYKRAADMKGRTQLKLGDKTFEDIPQPIQELWGVEVNPFINYMNSAQKLANLVSSQKVLSDLRQRFEGVYFFDPTKTSPEQMLEQGMVELGEVSPTAGGIRMDPDMSRTQQILNLEEFSPGGDIRTQPLDGVWTTPEVKEAFQDYTKHTEITSQLIKVYLRGNAAAKVGATVLSPRTFIRNFVGSAIFLPAQGHWKFTNFRQSWDASMGVFRNPESAENRAEFEKLVELDLIGKGARPGEIKDVIKDIDPNFSPENMMNMAGGRFTQAIKKGVMNASKAYELGDSFFRVQMFYLERARYQKADPSITDTQVAELVNNIYQDYSRTPEVLKRLRRNVFLAPFITFHYEVMRTSVNTVRQAIHELKHDNPAIKRIGAQRMVGFSLAAGIGAAGAAEALRMALGITEETMQALRDFSAPWNARSTLMPIDSYRGGGRYVNVSYTDPYEIIKEPIMMFFRDQSEDQFYQKAWRSFLRAIEPAMSPELFARATGEALMGRTLDGRDIVHPGDPPLDRHMARVLHMWDSMEPGFLKQGAEIFEALGDPEGDIGLPEALSALVGQRVVRVDANKSLPFKARDYQETVRELRSSMNARIRREGTTILDEVKELERVNKRKRDAHKKIERMMESAFKLGLDFPEIKERLMEGGMSGAEVDRIWRGQFDPIEINR